VPEAGKVGRLRAETAGVDCFGGSERNDQSLHAGKVTICHNSNNPASGRRR
jgi:hypothetical protein